MEQLSPDVLAIVCASLTGIDVFRLSHTSSWLRRNASAERIWQRVVEIVKPRPLSIDSPPADADANDQERALLLKKHYVGARSMRFRGTPRSEEERARYGCGNFVALGELPPSQESPSFTMILTGRGGEDRPYTSITLDAWFSLLPATDGVHAGGVLFGAQEANTTSFRPLHRTQQLATVDTSGKLHCSLLDSLESVELVEDVQLETDRWYHLVLTYSGPHRTEKVFLDDEPVASRIGTRPSDGWRATKFAQVGTGFIISSEQAPEPGFTGSLAGTAFTASLTTSASGSARSRARRWRSSREEVASTATTRWRSRFGAATQSNGNIPEWSSCAALVRTSERSFGTPGVSLKWVHLITRISTE